MGKIIKVKTKNTKQIIKDLGLDKNGRVTEFLRDDVYRLYEPYVPRDNGDLYRLDSGVTFPNAHQIEHKMPYAHYHYVGKVATGPSRPKGVKRTISNKDMKYQGAPKRGPEWDKRMMNEKSDEVYKDVQNFIDNGGK